MNSLIARAMDILMSTVNNHVQRAINSAITEQVLPQIQNTIRHNQGTNAENRKSQVDKPEPR